ncbi:MAG: phenylacetate--CoA ligase family protein [Xanthobacteraceae bacterium]
MDRGIWWNMSIAEQLYLDSLRQSQWLPPERLKQYQLPLLENLVRHAARQTDFYPDRLRPLFDVDALNDRPIDWSRWHEVPILRRSHASEHFEALKAREVPAEAGRTAEGMSSGSTGTPLKHLRSALSEMAANCTFDRACELNGVDMFGSLAMIIGDTEELYPYPHGMTKKRWNRTAPEASLFVLSTTTSPPEAFVEWLERVRPDHVMAYPVSLREIAEVALNRGGTSLRFKTFLSSGEVLDNEARDSIVRAFGCKIVDLYGAREIGQIAFQCPDGGGYHLSSEAVLCELLDDDGNEVAPGEFGRVVVTPLYNYAMPFIRYDLGDYAKRSLHPAVAAVDCRRSINRWPLPQPLFQNARWHAQAISKCKNKSESQRDRFTPFHSIYSDGGRCA